MTDLNQKSFEQMLAANRLALVDFWAVWCGPCKIMAPVLDNLADEMEGKAAFGKVNVDDHGELAQRYEITHVPTLIVFKDGVEVDRLVGIHPKEKLADMLGSYLTQA